MKNIGYQVSVYRSKASNLLTGITERCVSPVYFLGDFDYGEGYCLSVDIFHIFYIVLHCGNIRGLEDMLSIGNMQ
jgi:hypothetical protein